MPRCCSVFGCTSNYRKHEQNISTFTLPKDELLRSKWLKSIPTDFKNIKNPIVCAKHFTEECIVRVDRFLVNGEWKDFPRQVPKLKKGSVPTLFPNLPQYLSKTTSTSRRLPDVENENIEKAIRNSLADHKKYVAEKSISSIDDVISHFSKNRDRFKNEWSLLSNDSKIVFCYIDISDKPSLTASLAIHKDLEFEVFIGRHKIAKNRLPSTCKILNTLNVFDEIMKVVEKEMLLSEKEVHCVDSAIKLLESCDSDNVQFICEQLKLHQTPKNNTMIIAALLYVHSTSAYISLYKRNILYLPHYRSIQKLISKFSLKGSSLEGSMQYLASKKEYLNPNDFVVNLLLDEIYIEPQYSFKAGAIFGSSETDVTKAAKTAQVFMISSAFSRYKDVVSIVPVHNMRAEQLKSLMMNVLSKVEEVGFQVLSFISDNNVINRKAFELLTANKILQPSIPHPLDDSRLLFLIFDSVHELKCVRNNWISKSDDGVSITYPDINNDTVLKTAQFKHLRTLYQLEKDSFVKFGHTLSLKALYPSTTQKQNVKLTLNVINEKNIAALTCAVKSHPTMFPGVEDTCDFLRILVTWWKIVNVQNPCEGNRLNDKYREPIKSVEDMQMEYIKSMCLWLKKWRVTVPIAKALSAQTFQALVTTNEAFTQLIPYVFEKYGVKYILLGKFQNDNLESRFGKYRQLSGANYYISFVQLLESERKIRFKNSVILSSTRGDILLKTLIPCQESLSEEVNIVPFMRLLQEELDFKHVPKDILKVLTFICGYCVYKELQVKKCDDCEAWLLSDKKMGIDESSDLAENCDENQLINNTSYVIQECETEECIDEELVDTPDDIIIECEAEKCNEVELNDSTRDLSHDVSEGCHNNQLIDIPTDFIQECDRGKLTVPSQDALYAGVIVWHTLQKVLATHEEEFYAAEKHLSLLHKLSIMRLSHQSSRLLFDLRDTCQCSKTFGHSLEKISLRMCRTLLSNVVKSKNDIKHSSKSTQSKIKKLKGN